MKLHFLLIALVLWPFTLFFAQPIQKISLEDCYTKVQDQYPLSQSRQLLLQQHALKISQIDAATLPDIQWNSRARLQSEVVRFPLQLPGVEIPQLPLYNIQTALEASYILMDGGLASARKSIEDASLNQQTQALNLELEQLKPRVNELIFAILLLRSKSDIMQAGLQRLQLRQQHISRNLDLGVATQLELNRISAEILKLESQSLENDQAHSAAITALSIWLQSPLADSISFELPDLSQISSSEPAIRAEHRLFDAQKNQIAAKELLLTASNKPLLSAWAQAGIGYPNPFNFFDNQISPFGALGLALKWRVTDWKQTQRDQQLLQYQQNLIELRRLSFDRTLDANRQQILNQIRLSTILLEKDSELLALQQQMLAQIASQLQNGTATITDYLEQENTLRQTEFSLQTKKIQTDILKINLLIINGKL
jgi:outer membrane protein TolC